VQHTLTIMLGTGSFKKDKILPAVISLPSSKNIGFMQN